MIIQNIETRMRWRKIGFWSLVAVFGILVLAASWLWTADLGVFKPQIERWVSEKTGRTLRIGDLSIDLAGRIVVVGRDVSFANSDGALPEHMVSLGRAEIEVDLASLFSPPVIIEAVEINDAAIHLTVPADGPPNWELDIAGTESRPAAQEPEGLSLLLRDARIFNLKLVYVSAERPKPLELAIVSATQRLRDDGFLDLKVSGALSGRDMSVEGEIGTWQSLLAARDIDYRLTGRFDSLDLASAGHIDDLSRPEQPTLSFEASGPDIDHLTAMLGLGSEGTGDIAIAGTLSRDAVTGMRLHLSGNLGETSMEASASFESLTDLDRIDAEVRSSGPDLSQVLALAGMHGLQRAPFQLIADLERAGPDFRIHKAEMLFGEAQFLLSANLPRFPSVDDGTAQLTLRGSDLARFRSITGLPGAASGPFTLEAGLSVDSNQREFFEFGLETSLGRVSAKGEVRGGDTYLGTTSEIDVEVFDASATAEAWQLDLGPVPAERFAATGAIEYVDGAIRTTRPLTASLGELSINAEGSLALAEGAVGSNFLVQASGERLTLVTDPFTDSAYIPPDEFNVTSHLLIERGGIRLNDISGTLGSASIGGEANIRFAPRITGSAITFSASGDALENVVAYLPALNIRPGPFDVTGGIRFAEDALHIENLHLTRQAMVDAKTSISVGLPIERNWFKIEFDGESDDARGFLSPLKGFDASDVPFTLDLSAERNGNTLRVDRLDYTMADARLSASGTLDFRESLDSTRFRLKVDVPSLARLGTVGGREFHDQAFSFDGLVDGVRGQLRIEDARMTVANSDLTGSMTYTVDPKPTLTVDVTSDRLAVQPLFVRVEDDQPREPRESPDGRVIPDVAIPFDALEKMDASLSIRIGELERGDLYLRQINFDGEIRDGALEIRDASFHARSGYLRGNARLEPGDGVGRARIGLIADDLAFGLAETNTDLRMTGDININAAATGNDLRTLAGSLTGILLLDTNGGEIPNNRMMQLLYGDALNEILATINPFMKSEPVTAFRCIVIPLDIADGELEANPAAFVRTDKLNLTFRPEIDLKTERIDVSIRSTPRTVLSISAAELINPYIKVIGTMAKPSLAVDEQGVLISGGAAVATGGLSLLAKAAWDRLSRSSKPCESAREEAGKALSDRYPDIEPLVLLPPMPASTVPDAD